MTKRRTPRRLLSRAPSRRLNHETLEKRELLAIDIIDGAPRLVGANPNAEGLFSDDSLNELEFSPSELTFRFDGGQRLDPTTFGGITISSSGGDDTFGDGNEEQIIPGFLGFRDNEQTVVARFAETLPDDRYRIEISGEDDATAGRVALRNFFGLPFRTIIGETIQTIDFDVETGGNVIAVVPQPIDSVDGTLVRRDNEIDVYFDDDDLFRPGSNIAQPQFYQLVDTRGTVTTEDDQSFNPVPSGVTVDPVLKRVTLEFSSSLETLVAGASGTSFRLRIGDNNDFTTLSVTPVTPAVEPGLTAASATDLTGAANAAAINGTWTLLVDQQIDNGTLPAMADNPGGIDEIGHRDIEVEAHLGGGDGDNAISRIAYTFLKNRSYGNDANGDPLFNEMNAAQEQRFKEVLELYDHQFGIDFYETEGSGLKLIVGDLFTADPGRVSGPGGIAGLGGPGGVTMDFADFTTSASNRFGGSFFNVALHEIGHAIGLGHAYDLEGAVMGGGGAGDQVFPNPHDILHGEYLHQKESLDVDLYRVVLDEAGVLSAQTLAERLSNSSLLDSRLSLFREDDDGNTELIAANDDYFGADSLLQIRLNPGTYYIGVSAEGNDSYDIQSGLTSPGGVSEGAYELRLEFRPDDNVTIVDADGSSLDGDRDGVVGGNYNFWFEAAAVADTLYVRKPDIASDEGGDGSLAAPFDNIDDALAVAAGKANAVVRVVGNDGLDNDLTTVADNEAYEIGFVPGLNVTLDDGRNINLTDNTTLVLDAGVILKALDSRILVGSDDDGVNRSGSSIQVLGTPDLPVYFTSFNDHTKGVNSNPNDDTPASGDWGGIEIRNDVDRSQGRKEAERQGIFQNYINHASFEFGGGRVSTINRAVDPVHLSDARAEVSYNTIVNSSNGAISADPNTFEVTSFSAPRFQRSSVSGDGFVADYSRIGPDVHGNVLFDNEINGLFIRVDTLPGSQLETLKVAARLDDTDIAHVFSESLLVQGQPGGPTQETERPSPILGLSETGGGSIAAGTYRYVYTFVDQRGYESITSATQTLSVSGPNNAIAFSGITAATGDFVSRRLYRSDNGGSYRLVADLNRATTTYTDRLAAPDADAPTISLAGSKFRTRPDASLIVDPGMVIKSDGARIELGFGTTLIAEGNEGRNVIFTSIHDDRFGNGSTFDTNNDGPNSVGPAPGDWAGIYAGRVSRASIDQAVLAYGGGLTGVEGSTAGFNVLEIHQADARIANSLFEFNADGSGGQAGGNRQGRLANSDSTLHITGAQPTIVANTFVDNSGAAINIDVNSLNSFLNEDAGRQTGNIELFEIPPANNGPVIRANKLDRNDVNGLEIRGNTLFTEVVWDDTDIVHVVRDDVVSTNFHTYNGLRLESSDSESLVVKLEGAALSATGASLDITDRIGGRLQVLGTPGNPVVMTSLSDCTAGAGFTPDGRFQVETIAGLTCFAEASTQAPFVDIIVVMDETVTMRNTQVFTAQFIQDLDAGLLAAGIGSGSLGANRYGAVGFASRIQGELGRSIPVGAGGQLFGTAAEYAGIVNQYASDGFSEDGYSGIEFAIQNYAARPEAAKFIILASDEDRDILVPGLTFTTTLASLQSEGFNFQAIVDINIQDDAGTLGLAIDAQNTYLESGNTFIVSPGGTITGGFGTTVQDYFGLVTATGGIAGDIDQIAVSPQTANVFSQVLVSSIVGQAGGDVDTGTPGDWDGLRLDPNSHDRNVSTSLELEGNVSSVSDTNSVIGNHQDLGRIAKDLLSGDESTRLGATVHGSIAAGSDQDVYSFKGTAGSLVWIDIDRTDAGLDTVVEFLDGDGTVLALSDNSRAESVSGNLTYVNPRDEDAGDFVGFNVGEALPMQRDPNAKFNARGGGNKDLYSINDGDSGMRVVLPGTPGSELTYYVRVRSADTTTDYTDPAQIASSLTDGQTRGGYELQIRLREEDEIGGSVIKYADIRYATVGIEAIGLPAHSPLAGEVFNPGGTVNLGGMANTDRGAISIGGTANGSADSYIFTVGRDGLQNAPGTANADAPDNKVSTVIDVDYADGLQRPNTGAYLYHDGVLVAIGTDSNVLDDRLTPSIPNQTTDTDILGSGSYAPKDAFIGPLELSTIGTYEVVIANNQQVPPELLQFSNANAANPLLRLEPLDSTIRIADDRFDVGVENKPLPIGPQGPVALQVAFGDAGENIAAWDLGDVPLIALTDSDIGGNSRLSIYNPLTGRHDSIISRSTSTVLGAIARSRRGDIIAIRENGTAARNDANTSTVYSIDVEGALNQVGTTGIATYEHFLTTGANPDDINRLDNEGMEFSSLTFYNDTNSQTRYLYGLANRGTFDGSTVIRPANTDEIGPTAGFIDANNLIYRLDPDTGAAQSKGGNTMTGGFESANPLDPLIQNNYNNFNFGPETPWAGTNIVAQVQVPTVSPTTGFNTGNVVDIVADLNGGQFLLAFTDQGAVWQVNFSETNTRDYDPGDVRDFAGILVDPTLPGAAAGTDFVADQDGNRIRFENVTAGPANYQNAENPSTAAGLYYAIGRSGGGQRSLYAFNMATRTAQQVFAFNSDRVTVSDATTSANFRGFFFSSLDQNLWHLSDTNEDAPGHGMPELDNQARPNIGGGAALRFGFDALNNDFSHLSRAIVDNNLDASDMQNFNGYNFLGGAHGVVQSHSLDLTGFVSEDLPTLYFTYLLDSERLNSGGNLANNPMRDSLRVYVAGDNGDWALVATNNFDQNSNANIDWDDPNNPREYDPDRSDYGNKGGNRRFVQQLFDGDGYRQARIDLGEWAGEEDVKIRFEFSTAGEARPDQSEIIALPGNLISDGHTFTVSGQMPDKGSTDYGDVLPALSKTFEFDVANNGVGFGRIPVDIDVTMSITEVRDAIQRAMANEIHFVDAVPDSTARFIETLVTSGSGGLLDPHGIAIGPNGDVYVSSVGPEILRYDGVTGNFIEVAVDASVFTNFTGQGEILVRGNEVFLANVGGDSVLRFDLLTGIALPAPGLTGADFIAPGTGGLDTVRAMTFGPDGNLYVASNFTAEVLRFDGTTGAMIDTFVTAGSGGLLVPNAVRFGSDGMLYVADSTGDNVLRYQGPAGASPGAFDVEFVGAGSGGLDGVGAAGMQFGPNGDLFVSSRISNEVIRYDGTTGAFVEVVVGAGVGGLTQPKGLVFDTDGTLLAVSGGTNEVLRYDPEAALEFNTNSFPVVGDGVKVYDLSVSQATIGQPLKLVQGQYSNGPNLPASEFGLYQGSPTNRNDLIRAGQRTTGLGGGNGVYLDDIVIGLAERGESVGGAAATGTPVSNLASNPYFEPVFDEGVLPEIVSGPYQLEVRLGREYGDPMQQTADILGKLGGGRVEINERLAEGLNLIVNSDGGQIVDGSTFTLSNGTDTLTFEFNLGVLVQPGNVEVSYNSTDTAGEVAQAIRNAINQIAINNRLGIIATNRGGQLSTSPVLETDEVVVIHGDAAATTVGGTNFGPYLTAVISGTNQVPGEDNGDRNRIREQGQLLIDSNIVSFSSDYGIVVDAGPTGPIGPFNAGNSEGNRPKPGAVRRFPTLNTSEQIPGAVVRNNLLYNNVNGGLRLSGDTSVGAPSGYARAVNNTIYGSTVGIRIDDQAAPALLNNVLMNNGTGIVGVNESETLIRATLYEGNGRNVNGVALGTEAIVDPGVAIFVNPNPTGFDFAAGAPNFYPVAGSPVIDASVPSQNDRPLLVSVKEVLGIPPSPVLVTARDLLGQNRGQPFFTDRGAIDRLDQQGPIASLLVPLDNDPDGLDVDPRQNSLQLIGGRLFEFTIQLDDAGGTGADASTITPNRITVTENGRVLGSGADYILGYSSNSGLLRLTPTSGEFRPDAVYVIRLSNSITDLAGNPLTPNQPDGSIQFTIVMPDVEFDYGDAPDIYGTSLVNNGARHPILGGTAPVLGSLIDSDDDAHLFPDSDDLPHVITAAASTASLSVDDSVTNVIAVTVDPTVMAGDTLTLSIDGTPFTFELTESTSNPVLGNIVVPFTVGDTADEIAASFVDTITNALTKVTDALQIGVDPANSSAFTVEATDDEEGVPVGRFVGTAITEGLFLSNNSGQTSDPSDVVAFLNRADAAGAVLPITVTGNGLLDAWIDFNGDGDFGDFGERIPRVSVSDGVNQLRVFTPNSAVVGPTWARFRVSTGGTDSPGGIATDGEVEDYRVSIFDVAPPDPVDDDFYTVIEDQVLTVDGTIVPSLSANDVLPTEEFIQPRYVIDAPRIPHPTEVLYRTANGQVRVDDPVLGLFTYTPDEDFEGADTFRYAVSTQRNEGPEFAASADFATVTITVTPFNYPPVFDIPAELDVLEDDANTLLVEDFFTNVSGGPAGTGMDEQIQIVTFTIAELSATPANLMAADPDVSSGSSIEFFPTPDLFGTAVYVVTGTDDGVPSESVSKTFTVNVRPVNDAPRFDPNVAGTSDLADPDTAYSVANNDFDGNDTIDDATITYTLREDNTQVFGDTSTPFFIPLNAATGAGYQQVGLLDVFTVGPDNEVNATPGGSQVLELFDFGNAPTGGNVDISTDLGGILRPVMSGGTLIGLEYTPPVNFSSSIGGFDSFSYSVRDDSTTGGESWDLAVGDLVADRMTSTNRVLLNLNPVNDRPEFDVSAALIEVPEDSTPLIFTNYAFNISAGPSASAFDEIDLSTGQNVAFTLTPLDFAAADAADFFTALPVIDENNGSLRFQAAPDVFGEFEFEIRLVDDGLGSADGNNPRGDINTSLPTTLTIDVQPINDAPKVDPTSDPLQFTLLEDGTVDIMVNGDATTPGLLDVFLVGPANEAEDILPDPGGNQTLSLGTPVPRASFAGGTLQTITDPGNGEVIGLRYRPRKDFVGMDSFIYTVVDDGSSVGIGTGGIGFSDPRISSNTVSLEVLPVNDAPLFSGASNVVSDEDQGAVVVDSWANNVQAGPTSAVDEINGQGATPPQSLEFVITQTDTTNAGLFASPPVAVISGDSASLMYQTAADANGSATFEVYLQDDGPSDAGIGDQFRGPVTTFSINVRSVNDPPVFTPGLSVVIDEDSGPYSQPWASAISPGPSDEAAQSVRFEVTTPPEFQSLFQSQPVINDDGELRFTSALNANTDNTLGPAQIEITAVDSEDGQSAPVTLSITIREINDTPIAVADSIDTDEDAVLTITSADVLANDIDPDLQSNANEVLTVVMPTESFSISGARVTFDPVSGDITYDPSQSSEIQSLTVNESLTDSFSYSVRDASGALSGLVTVGLNIDGINDAPRLTDDAVDLSPTGLTIIRPLDNDTDVDGIIDVTSIIITLQPAFGGITIRPDGTLQYTNFVAFSVEDQFQYTVADDLGARSAPAEVIISANAAPIAVNDAKGTFLDESINIDVAANDSDPDGFLDLNSIIIVTPPTRGQVLPQDGGIVQYLPEPGFVGRDSFTYRIFDNEGRGSNVATVATRVVASRLQNPDIATDVNQDGFTTALDALLVINHLTRADGAASIPVLPTDSGPNFYDVNGNQSITTLDAVVVINELSRLSLGGPAGEQVQAVIDSSVDTGTDLGASVAEQTGAAIVADPVKAVDTSSETDSPVSDDLVDLIAADRDSDNDEDQSIAALDAAMADLL